MNSQDFLMRQWPHPRSYYAVSCRIATELPPATVLEALHAAHHLRGWFTTTAAGDAPACLVSCTRLLAPDEQRLTAAGGDRAAAARALLAADLRQAPQRPCVFALRQILDDLAAAFAVGEVTWNAPAPVPAMPPAQLALPLRADVRRSLYSTAVVDCLGAELFRATPGGSELGEMLWRANLYPDLIEALAALLPVPTGAVGVSFSREEEHAQRLLDMCRQHAADAMADESAQAAGPPSGMAPA